MRVLLLNWRDIRSSRGGGAERVTHEVAKRLVRRGHEVTWLSSREPELAAEETVEGVRILRRGSELTTRFYAARAAGEFAPDVVLEEINTLPYLAPLWAKTPVVLYMNQLARDVWWYEAPRPLAAVGWMLEPAYLQAYRRCDAVTISESSQRDLRRFGVGRRIAVAPMAVDVPIADAPASRSLEGRLIAIGRLTPSKRYDQAITALVRLRETHRDASLDLVGSGRSERALRSHAAKLGVSTSVRFRGNLDESAKVDALDAADVLVGTSVREGWGLTVTEAAARGMPSAVYDVAGFRDSVVSGRTGVVTRPSPEALADGIRSLIADRGRYEEIGAAARARVASLSWEATADAFESSLARALGSPPEAA